MSKVLALRNNTTIYITDQQAENIFQTLNDNPNVRILKIVTGSGFQYISPFAIITITPMMGDGYMSNAQLEEQQQKYLSSKAAQAINDGSTAGLVMGGLSLGSGK